MSVLVVAKSLCAIPMVERVPVDKLELSISYTEALATWGISDVCGWDAIVTWNGRLWGELVNDSVVDSRSRTVLVRAIVDLGENCEELAIWYAGFPDDVPVVQCPSDLAQVLDEQLSAGDLEPAVRMVRSRR